MIGTTDKIISSWNYIDSEGIPINSLAKIFLFNTLFKNIVIDNSGTLDVNSEIQLSNKSPDIIILLSLCFWIKRCKGLAVEKIYNEKFTELKCNLDKELIEKTLRKVPHVAAYLKDTGISKDNRNDTAEQFISEIQDYLKTSISFLSEFLIYCIIKDNHFDVDFIPANNDVRKCDLQLEGNKVEIKSFIDDFRYGPKIGNSLQDETIGSLKRDKFWVE